MIRVFWVEGEVTRSAMYDTVADVISGEDVQLFIDFIKDGNSDPSNADPTDLDVIKEDLASCTTVRELQAVFAEHFDYYWLILCVCEVEATDVKAVLKSLQDRSSMEMDERGAVYYLHITDEGDIVDDVSKADISFCSVLDEEAYKDFASDYDWRDDVEVEDNKYFLAVAKDLTNQVIDYFTIK